jgi:TetR/AcrR family transcriptional regulator, regulator of autoinduction and epiphytic fitness
VNSPKKGAPGTKRAAILDAALKLFSQYGYRRTSIDDIAREAEIAKGTVYLSFKSKEEIFRALCESLIERMESAVKLAREASGPIDDRLVAILEAKFGLLFETVYRSAHAAELMDSKNRLSADLFAQSGRRYMKVLREVIEDATRAGELAPSRMELDADDLAHMLVAAAHGVENNATTPARYHRRLREIVRVIVAGLSVARGEVRA